MPNPTLTAALAAARVHYNHRNAIKIKAGYAAAFDGLSESERTTEAIAAAKAIAAYEAARLRPMSEAPTALNSSILVELRGGERRWFSCYQRPGATPDTLWVSNHGSLRLQNALGFVRAVLPGEDDAP